MQNALDGYKVAFVSDAHTASETTLQGIVKNLNSSNINLLLLGGDFSYSKKVRSTPKSMLLTLFNSCTDEKMPSTLNKKALNMLSKIKTTDGSYGVEGNHDDHIELFDAMTQCGITPLSNSGVQIRSGLYVAGLEDMQNRNPSVTAATTDACKDDFVLLLSHNPDVTMQQDTSNVDVVLCGHTHGGQVSFLNLWAPIFTISKRISAYGQRFMSGWSRSRDGTPVFVSKGIGSNHKLPRIYAQPQVIVLTLLKNQ